MSESPPSAQRFENLDLYRGLAALAVCLFHFGVDQPVHDRIASDLLGHGYLGFDVFFVISGFVIPLALEKSHFVARDYGSFLLKRFLRLYPAYFASGVLVLVLWYASSLYPGFRGAAPHVSARQIVGNLTLTADLLDEPWLNPVYWTLAIEVQYYLLIGLCYPALTSTSAGIRWAVIATWLLIPLILPLHATVFEYGALFGLGIAAFLYATHRIDLRGFLACLIAGLLVQGLHADWLSAGAALATALAIAWARFEAPRSLVFLGTISYSLYLVHVPFGGKVIHALQRLHGGPGFAYGVILVAVILTVGAAYLFYRAIERPSHAYSRRIRAKA